MLGKKGDAALFIFLAFAVVALIGMIYVMMTGSPTGRYGEMLGCQSSCFGRTVGEPEVGQEQGLAGSALRECLADCQAGIPYQHPEIQECYHCSCPSEAITADDRGQAMVVCGRVCGSEATIIAVDGSPCKY